MEKTVAKAQRQQSLQDSFLNTVRKEKMPVFIFLVSGIKLNGYVDSFDQYVVVLKNTPPLPKSGGYDDPNVRIASSQHQMVYKHAISTIVPGNDKGPGHHSKPRD